MTMTMRRYGGRGKMSRDSRYLGGWAAFARGWSLVTGSCVDFEHAPELPGFLRATVTHAAAGPCAAPGAAQTMLASDFPPQADVTVQHDEGPAVAAAAITRLQQDAGQATAPAHPVPISAWHLL